MNRQAMAAGTQFDPSTGARSPAAGGRRGVLLAGLALLAGATLPAFAQDLAKLPEGSAEAFVMKNAQLTLDLLNDPKLSKAARTTRFKELMEQFSDFDAIGKFALGRYGRKFTGEVLERYQAAFRSYALAVYESKLDQYRGKKIEFAGVTPRKPEDVLVQTLIPQIGQDSLEVSWRVNRVNGQWKIVDVKLWGVYLAIEQRSEFEAYLMQNNGDPEALIAQISRLRDKLLREGIRKR